MYQQNNEGVSGNKKKRTAKEKENDLKRSIRQQTKNLINDQKNESMFEAGRRSNSIGGRSNYADYFETKKKTKPITGKKTELLTYTQAGYLLGKVDLSEYLFNDDASNGLRLDYLYDINNNEIRIERRNVIKLRKRLKV
jgi:hypothetical protein